MSEFKKLNGYDVEDETARNQIFNLSGTLSATRVDLHALQDTVGTLESDLYGLSNTVDTLQEKERVLEYETVQGLETRVSSLESNSVSKSNFVKLSTSLINLPSGEHIFTYNYPTGFTHENSYVVGGTYTVSDSNGNIIAKKSIHTPVYDTNNNLVFRDDISYYFDDSQGTSWLSYIIFNDNSLFVGSNLDVELILMKYEI